MNLQIIMAVVCMPVAFVTAAGTRPKAIFPDAKPVCPCASLTNASIPNTTIVSAVIDSSDGSCRVTARVTHPPVGDRVKVLIALPMKDWNGRFRGVGGGGWRGGIEDDLQAAVALGYATGLTDAGNGEDGDRIWWNERLDRANEQLDWEAIANFAYRGVHDMTIEGKALTEAFYGKPPRYSYFSGISTGGRQGLMEAQRFPDDYDGILAGAPAINLPRLMIGYLWPQMVMLEAKNFPPKEKFDAARAAAVAACDESDGVKDGVIDDPLRCDFDPKALVGTKLGESVFTESDAEVVRRIWEGPRLTDGSLPWYGLARGTDLCTLTRVKGSPAQDRGPLGVGWVWNFLLSPKAEWSWRTLTLREYEMFWKESVVRYDHVFATADPDLTRFRNRGGKVLIYHGLADDLIPPGSSIEYYSRVRDTMGGKENTAQFVRLFLVPGVNHSFLGTGPSPTGLMEAVIRWVEEGKAPDKLIGERRDADGKLLGTRPLFPYPKVAKYKGSGNTEDAANFVSTVVDQ